MGRSWAHPIWITWCTATCSELPVLQFALLAASSHPSLSELWALRLWGFAVYSVLHIWEGWMKREEWFSAVRNRKSAAYLQEEGLHFVICFWFFSPGWSTEVPVREQHIVFWDRFATDAGWYGCSGVLSKAVSHEAFCNAAPGCSLIHVLAVGGCLPLQRFSQAQYSPGHLLLHSPDLFSVSNLVRM